MPSIRVAHQSEVRPGTMKVVQIDGSEILLANSAGRMYAMDNVCRHMGGSLGDGRLEGNTVVCPGHGCTWDIASGRPIITQRPALPLQTYQVKVEGGAIILYIPRRTPVTVTAGTRMSDLERMANLRYTKETCSICGSRIDELGYCACGAGGS